MGSRLQPPGIIQVGDIAQKLRTAFGIKGKTVAPQLGDLVHPVCIVEDLTRSSWYNPVERPGGGGIIEFVPTAAQFASIQLFNPAGSNVVIIVDTVIVSSDGACRFELRQTATALANLVTNGANWRDVVNLTGAPIGEIRDQSFAALPGGSIVGGGAITGNLTEQVQIGSIYPPGNGLRVDSTLPTVGFSAFFLWRERYREPVNR